MRYCISHTDWGNEYDFRNYYKILGSPPEIDSPFNIFSRFEEEEVEEEVEVEEEEYLLRDWRDHVDKIKEIEGIIEDSVKDKITDGTYLELMNQLGNLYKLCK